MAIKIWEERLPRHMHIRMGAATVEHKRKAKQRENEFSPVATIAQQNRTLHISLGPPRFKSQSPMYQNNTTPQSKALPYSFRHLRRIP